MNPLNFMVKGIKSPFPRFLALQPVANMFSRSHYYFIKIYPILDPAVYNYSSNFRDFIFLLTLRNISKMLVTKVRIKTIPAFVLYNRGIRIQFYTMEVFVFSFVQWRYSYSVLYNMEIFIFSFVQWRYSYSVLYNMEVFIFRFVQWRYSCSVLYNMEVFVFHFVQWWYSYSVFYNRGIHIQFYTMKVFEFSLIQYGGIRIPFCTMEVFIFSFIQKRYSYSVL